MTKLLDLDFRSEKVEIYLQMLVDGIDDLNATEAELGIDIRNMVKILGKYTHNDDQHHNGETILEHIQWVLEDVQNTTEDKRPDGLQDRRQILSLVALLHDLGKGYTHAILDGRHTFWKHAEISTKLTRAMLWELRRDDPYTYERIEDLVRLHDAFIHLLNAQKTAEGFKYIKRFMQERIYPEGLQDLIWFYYADGARAKRFSETRKEVESLMQNIKQVEQERANAKSVKARWANPPEALVDSIHTLLESEALDSISLLPDLKAVNKALGKEKQYEVLMKIRKLVEG